jgi:hypothetical protein
MKPSQRTRAKPEGQDGNGQQDQDEVGVLEGDHPSTAKAAPLTIAPTTKSPAHVASAARTITMVEDRAEVVRVRVVIQQPPE